MSEITEFFRIGEKVRICGNQGFEIGVTGTIDYPPQTDTLTRDFGDTYFRRALTPKGETIFVWVVFDKPQFDADGDGPYAETEINIDNLELIKN